MLRRMLKEGVVKRVAHATYAIASYGALRGEKPHVVDWCGVYRGTESDPREVGYCQTCEREVYDGEAGHAALATTGKGEATSDSGGSSATFGEPRTPFAPLPPPSSSQRIDEAT